MDLTAILENKWPIAGVLAAVIAAMSAWPYLGKLKAFLPVKSAPSGPSIREAFAAIEVLAEYAKATGNHSLSRAVIDVFDDVANVPEVAE
jgi:hypothetical protein